MTLNQITITYNGRNDHKCENNYDNYLNMETYLIQLQETNGISGKRIYGMSRFPKQSKFQKCLIMVVMSKVFPSFIVLISVCGGISTKGSFTNKKLQLSLYDERKFENANCGIKPHKRNRKSATSRH